MGASGSILKLLPPELDKEDARYWAGGKWDEEVWRVTSHNGKLSASEFHFAFPIKHAPSDRGGAPKGSDGALRAPSRARSISSGSVNLAELDFDNLPEELDKGQAKQFAGKQFDEALWAEHAVKGKMSATMFCQLVVTQVDHKDGKLLSYLSFADVSPKKQAHVKDDNASARDRSTFFRKSIVRFATRPYSFAVHIHTPATSSMRLSHTRPEWNDPTRAPGQPRVPGS